MNLTIRPLSQDSAKDFTDYFDNLDFSHQPNWKGCYCQFYHLTCTDREWRNRLPEQNRARAMESISRGSMKGYLAYAGEQCVGWCNANNLNAYGRLSHLKELEGFDDRTGVVICFVIYPDYRHQGVARQLLRAAVAGFRQGGYARVLGLPVERKDHPELQYRGTRKMFEEAGFLQINQDDQHPILSLQL